MTVASLLMANHLERLSQPIQLERLLCPSVSLFSGSSCLHGIALQQLHFLAGGETGGVRWLRYSLPTPCVGLEGGLPIFPRKLAKDFAS